MNLFRKTGLTVTKHVSCLVIWEGGNRGRMNVFPCRHRGCRVVGSWRGLRRLRIARLNYGGSVLGSFAGVTKCLISDRIFCFRNLSSALLIIVRWNTSWRINWVAVPLVMVWLYTTSLFSADFGLGRNQICQIQLSNQLFQPVLANPCRENVDPYYLSDKIRIAGNDSLKETIFKTCVTKNRHERAVARI